MHSHFPLFIAGDEPWVQKLQQIFSFVYEHLQDISKCMLTRRIVDVFHSPYMEDCYAQMGLEGYGFKPTLGPVPTFNLPSILPNLPMVADDINWSGAVGGASAQEGESIAPSLGFFNALPDVAVGSLTRLVLCIFSPGLGLNAKDVLPCKCHLTRAIQQMCGTNVYAEVIKEMAGIRPRNSRSEQELSERGAWLACCSLSPAVGLPIPHHGVCIDAPTMLSALQTTGTKCAGRLSAWPCQYLKGVHGRTVFFHETRHSEGGA